MPLSMLGLGRIAKVVGLNGKPEVKKFLAGLGFIAGEQVRVLQNTSGNNIIIGKGGLRFALDRRTAHCVLITPVEEELCRTA